MCTLCVSQHLKLKSEDDDDDKPGRASRFQGEPLLLT